MKMSELVKQKKKKYVGDIKSYWQISTHCEVALIRFEKRVGKILSRNISCRIVFYLKREAVSNSGLTKLVKGEVESNMINDLRVSFVQNCRQTI